jgi:hypothetical protein
MVNNTSKRAGTQQESAKLSSVDNPKFDRHGLVTLACASLPILPSITGLNT